MDKLEDELALNQQRLSKWTENTLKPDNAAKLTPKQNLIREMILQLKTGNIDLNYFTNKFGVDVWSEFREVYERLEREQFLTRHDSSIKLTRSGLLQVDHFLAEFFEPELKAVRYV